MQKFLHIVCQSPFGRWGEQRKLVEYNGYLLCGIMDEIKFDSQNCCSHHVLKICYQIEDRLLNSPYVLTSALPVCFPSFDVPSMVLIFNCVLRGFNFWRLRVFCSAPSVLVEQQAGKAGSDEARGRKVQGKFSFWGDEGEYTFGGGYTTYNPSRSSILAHSPRWDPMWSRPNFTQLTGPGWSLDLSQAHQ